MPWAGGRRTLRRLAPDAVWQRDPQADVLATMVRQGPAIDVGAGGRVLSPATITIDAVAHPGTRLVADIVDLPLRAGAVRTLVCTGTLEHVPDPVAAVREFARVLHDDGVAHVEVPFMQPFHADPHDYWRFTAQGLEVLFARWRIERSGSHMGSGAGAAWVLQEAVKGLFRNRLLRALAHGVVAVLVQPLRLLDRPGRPAGPAASGFYVRAQRPLDDTAGAAR